MVDAIVQHTIVWVGVVGAPKVPPCRYGLYLLPQVRGIANVKPLARSGYGALEVVRPGKLRVIGLGVNVRIDI
jgi:hypothetical protein